MALKDVLNELSKVEGVLMAAVVGRDGFVIEKVGPPEVDSEGVGAMAATAMGTIESLGSELKNGKLEQSMTEYKNGVIILSGLDKDSLLSLVAKKEASVGRLRYEVKKNKEKIIKEL